MTLLLDVWARGALVVCLVSLNTRLLADGRWSAIGVATLLSCVWWLNARSASRANGPAAMVALCDRRRVRTERPELTEDDIPF